MRDNAWHQIEYHSYACPCVCVCVCVFYLYLDDLVGGMALHDQRLAEMATGEGKTLVALLPTYLNALTGKGAFVVTTNDYLARWRPCNPPPHTLRVRYTSSFFPWRVHDINDTWLLLMSRRDGENMGQVFRFLGMSVGVVQAYQKEDQRKVQWQRYWYLCLILYFYLIVAALHMNWIRMRTVVMSLM